MKKPVDQAKMIALFEDLRAAFPALTMRLDLEDPNVDLNMDVPQQAGLAFPINFNLQGDELHLSAGAFWLEWLPCTDSEVVTQYQDAAVGLLSGRYRILEQCVGKRVVKACLQRPIEGDWQTIGTWAGWGALFPWRRSTRVLQNGVLE